MPRCVNVPFGCPLVYYKGTEKSPLGNGVSPKYERVGKVMKGKDGQQYMVGYAGVNVKRWVRMHWLGFKQT